MKWRGERARERRDRESVRANVGQSKLHRFEWDCLPLSPSNRLKHVAKFSRTSSSVTDWPTKSDRGWEIQTLNTDIALENSNRINNLSHLALDKVMRQTSNHNQHNLIPRADATEQCKRLERQQQPTAIEGEKGAFVVKVEGGLLGKVGRGGGRRVWQIWHRFWVEDFFAR